MKINGTPSVVKENSNKNEQKAKLSASIKDVAGCTEIFYNLCGYLNKEDQQALSQVSKGDEQGVEDYHNYLLNILGKAKVQFSHIIKDTNCSNKEKIVRLEYFLSETTKYMGYKTLLSHDVVSRYLLKFFLPENIRQPKDDTVLRKIVESDSELLGQCFASLGMKQDDENITHLLSNLIIQDDENITHLLSNLIIPYLDTSRVKDMSYLFKQKKDFNLDISGCVSEHIVHIRHAGDIPIGYVGVEGFCLIEHIAHIRHAGDIPIGYVGVEGFCTKEHTWHIRHFGDIPIGYVGVEGFCIKEHTCHIRHFGDIPIGYVGVEGFCTKEHT